MLESLKGHLDGLQAMTRWILLFVVILWVGDVQGDDLFGSGMVHFRSDAAVPIAVALFFVITFIVFDHLWRMGDLLWMVDDTALLKAVGMVSYHRWAVNPYAQFHDSFASRLNSAKGLAAMAFLWVVTVTVLVDFRDVAPQLSQPLVLAALILFALMAAGTTAANLRVYAILSVRTRDHLPDFHRAFQRLIPYRVIAVGAGLVAAYFFCEATATARQILTGH